MTSIVGSSCIRPDASGLAPIRSPALTTYVSTFSEPSAFMCVAKYSAPPEGTASPVAGLTIVPGVPASRWPWKSLNASSLICVSFCFGRLRRRVGERRRRRDDRQCDRRERYESSFHVTPVSFV